MKMFIFLPLIITSIHCSYYSCKNETNFSNCSNHIINETSGIFCHFFLDDSNDTNMSGDYDNEEPCGSYPDSAKNQKIYWKLVNGVTKESISVVPEIFEKYILYDVYDVQPQKEFYEKNETILIRKKYISNEDKEFIASKNTCGYQFGGRIIDNIKNNYNYNLTDKNICFDTHRFPELKDLLNCGFAEITLNIEGKIYIIKTCFFIPDNHFPDDLNFYFYIMLNNAVKDLVGEMLDLGEIPWSPELEKNELNVELITEDKYGKKLKYINGKYDPEIIEEGTQGDKDYDQGIIISNNCSGLDFFMDKCIPSNDKNESEIIRSNYIYDILDDIENGTFNEIFENVITENKTYDAKENNITYIISTVSSQYSTNYSYVGLEHCESLLKEKFLLDKNESLILLKLEYAIDKFNIPIIEYQFFLKNGTKINQNYCENITETVSIPVKINEKEEFIHNPNSYFYNDKCSIYTSKFGTDLPMYDRKNDYNRKYLALCEKNCEYKGYNKLEQRVECECKTKINFPYLVDKVFNDEFKISLKELLHQFKDVIKHWNLFLFKCYKVVFSYEGFKNNSGSYINIIITSIIIFCSIFFIFKGYILYKNRIINIANKSLDNSMNNQTTKGFNNEGIFKRNDLNKIENNNKNINNNDNTLNSFNSEFNINIDNNLIKSYNDYDMNNLDYNDALIQDNRSFCQMYKSFIKTKQPILFTFFLQNDYNSKIIKICLFIANFNLEYTINALFFNDATMHKIYKDRGEYNFIYQIPQIIYSFLISLAITKLISLFILSEEKISKVIRTNNLEKENKINDLFKKSIWKLILFFIFIIILHLLFFYYLSSFCGVYKNTQSKLIINTMIDFAISLFVYSYIFCLIPCTMRYYSLRGINKDRKYLYKVSNILSEILL